SPVVLAPQNGMEIQTFQVDQTAFRVIFFGEKQNLRDTRRYVPTLRQIAAGEMAIMKTTPTSHYDFFFDVDGRGGGLEHLNCCRIALGSESSPLRFAPFAAHEMFHLWNVKRIRPAVLGPFDYIHPPKTRNLWFAEGVTEYYAYIATRRAGLMTE